MESIDSIGDRFRVALVRTVHGTWKKTFMFHSSRSHKFMYSPELFPVWRPRWLRADHSPWMVVSSCPGQFICHQIICHVTFTHVTVATSTGTSQISKSDTQKLAQGLTLSTTNQCTSRSGLDDICTHHCFDKNELGEWYFLWLCTQCWISENLPVTVA